MSGPELALQGVLMLVRSGATFSSVVPPSRVPPSRVPPSRVPPSRVARPSIVGVLQVDLLGRGLGLGWLVG